MNPQQSSPRAKYQKRMRQRQTVIFGSIGAVMAALLITSTLFWTNLVPFPFNREFSRKIDPTSYIPCIDKDTSPAALDKINVRVYNSTETQGLASKVRETLTEAGVTVTETTNWAGDPVTNSVKIFTSAEGVPLAYTLRGFFPQANVHFDPSLTGTQVDVVLGSKWDDKIDLVSTPTAEQYAAAMKPIKGCTALKDLPSDNKKK